MVAWWNSEYPFRHSIKLDAITADVFPAGHPITLVMPRAKLVDTGKLRSDLEDLEVVYYNAQSATPSYTVLGREAVTVDQNIEITFNVVSSFSGVIQDRYFVHYGNPLLEDQPARPSIVVPTWPVAVTSAGVGVSYTRPGEHWKNGASSTKDAVATFVFHGSKVRLISKKNPNAGVALVSVDGGAWEQASMYSPTEVTTEVYSKTGLEAGQHDIRVRVSNYKDPMSGGKEINVVRFEYRRTLTATDTGEELDPTLFWQSYTVGGVVIG
jgi:hypothetical protein